MTAFPDDSEQVLAVVSSNFEPGSTIVLFLAEVFAVPAPQVQYYASVLSEHQSKKIDLSDCQTTNRDGGDELSDSRPGLVPRFGKVAGDLLVDLRRRKMVGRSHTW